LKPSLKPRSAAIAALLALGLCGVATSAQAPQGTQNAAASPPPPASRIFPAPTNLKVLPKDLTGQQVRDIMERWEGALGVRCGSCHAEDPEFADPDGRPRLKFADDSKPMKTVARLMYSMTDEINSNYIAKLEGSGEPVTCGTCHRGHISPEPFTIQPPGEPPTSQVSPSGEERPQPQ
jgi:hypothetical protein